jgi:hypothetical protein
MSTGLDSGRAPGKSRLLLCATQTTGLHPSATIWFYFLQRPRKQTHTARDPPEIPMTSLNIHTHTHTRPDNTRIGGGRRPKSGRIAVKYIQSYSHTHTHAMTVQLEINRGTKQIYVGEAKKTRSRRGTNDTKKSDDFAKIQNTRTQIYWFRNQHSVGTLCLAPHTHMSTALHPQPTYLARGCCLLVTDDKLGFSEPSFQSAVEHTHRSCVTFQNVVGGNYALQKLAYMSISWATFSNVPRLYPPVTLQVGVCVYI